MTGRGLIWLVLGMGTIFTSVVVNLYNISINQSDNVSLYFRNQMAQNASQSGVSLCISQLATSSTWRTGFTNLNIMGTTITATVVDTIFQGENVCKITSVANYVGGMKLDNATTDSARIVSICYVRVGGFIPPTVIGTMSAPSTVTTAGTFTIDARNHNTAGTALNDGLGTYGVWSTQNFTQDPTSLIGGSAAGVDYAPSNPVNAAVIAQSQTYTGGFPSTPDSAMGGSAKGFSEGTLKTMAQSGSGGSQYVTDPTTITLPLSGVTYVELASGAIWDGMALTGSGIIIVHNSSGNAIMSNINSSTFNGLIMADEVTHINSTIIGAVVSLSSTPSSSGSLGNGSGSILYSRQAIINATSAARGSTTRQIPVITWLE